MSLRKTTCEAMGAEPCERRTWQQNCTHAHGPSSSTDIGKTGDGSIPAQEALNHRAPVESC